MKEKCCSLRHNLSSFIKETVGFETSQRERERERGRYFIFTGIQTSQSKNNSSRPPKVRKKMSVEGNFTSKQIPSWMLSFVSIYRDIWRKEWYIETFPFLDVTRVEMEGVAYCWATSRRSKKVDNIPTGNKKTTLNKRKVWTLRIKYANSLIHEIEKRTIWY